MVHGEDEVAGGDLCPVCRSSGDHKAHFGRCQQSVSTLPPPRSAWYHVTSIDLRAKLRRCAEGRGVEEHREGAALASHGRSRWFEPNHAHQGKRPSRVPRCRRLARGCQRSTRSACGSGMDAGRLGNVEYRSPSRLGSQLDGGELGCADAAVDVQVAVLAALMAYQFVDPPGRDAGILPSGRKAAPQIVGADEAAAYGWTLPRRAGSMLATCRWMLRLDPGLVPRTGAAG